jgi:hypothetical protein
MAGLLFALGAVAQTAGAWYKGDLHSHSTYSDGDSDIAGLLASASSKGFDFFTVTDHDNDLNGQPRHWFDPAYVSRTMVLLYGMEWSTGPGHASVWAAAPISYEPIWQANRAEDPAAAASAAAAQGALFSINHPGALCCPWEYPVVQGIDVIEVWNAMYELPSFNRWVGHHFWHALLSSGRKISGVGGSDTHHLFKWQSRFFGLGNPTTWVFATSKSGNAILAALKAGRSSISYAPDAPRLELSADANGDGTYETMMGGSVPSGSRAISFRIAIVPTGGAQAPPRSPKTPGSGRPQLTWHACIRAAVSCESSRCRPDRAP